MIYGSWKQSWPLSTVLVLILGGLLLVFPTYGEGGQKIRRGDKLSILILGTEKPQVQTYTVSRDGYLLLPNIGKVHVAGRKVAEVEKDLEKRYSQIFTSARVAITLLPDVQLKKAIYVLGAVRAPGKFPVQEAVSVVKAIALAGGFSEKADRRKILLLRQGQTSRGEVFDWESFRSGKSTGPLVQPEDVVYVEPLRQASLSILGKVRNPGRYPLSRPIALAEAIALAGGLLPGGELEALLLQRGKAKEVRIPKIREKLATPSVLDQKVAPGDTLVLTSPQKGQVSVFGLVQRPGRYTLPEKANVLHALSLAGGALPEAGTVTILKQNGQVRAFPLARLSSIANLSEIPSVEAGDSLFVQRLTKQRVYVLGRVKVPGAYPIDRPVRLHQALAMAGDVTKWGSRNGLKILRANGKVETFDLESAMEEGKASSIPLLYDGDTLYVP